MASKNERTLIQPFLLGLAVLALAGAAWRVFDNDPKLKVTDRINETTLLYLGVAGALLLLQDVKSLAFGDYKVEFERRLSEVEVKADNAQTTAIGRGGILSHSPSSETVGNEMQARDLDIAPGQVEDDPWKGVFGRSEAGGRKMLANVSPAGSPGLYKVYIQVLATDPVRNPLSGAVQFYLHPTFSNDKPIVTVSPSGVADLNLTACGAFTIGAIMDNGRSKLELDLAELPDAPSEFKSK
jgi:hypothetical protein